MMTNSFQHAYSIVMKLQQAKYIAYFAGGWVRDFILGRPSVDIDIATNATPIQIMDLFSETVLVGLSFGVVIVRVGDHSFEVASFRKDLEYKDGRHPQAIEMSTPQEDALRRDFTINGLFYDPIAEVIHDYVKGQEDMRHQVIRAIGNPYERFYEDRLRLLRAFRFAARLGFAIDGVTLEAIRENVSHLFPAVAKERVWQEFTKMAHYPRFDQALIEMHRVTLLGEIFPELKSMHLNELRHLVTSYCHFLPNCPPILYLMELFPTFLLSQKIEIAKRLTVPNKDLKLIELMDQLTHLFQQEKINQVVDLQQWAKALAHPHAFVCLQVLEARLDKQEQEIWHQCLEQRTQRLLPHIQRIITGKPVVSAALLKTHGIEPGIQMGVLLKESEQLAILEDWHEPTPILAKLRERKKI